MYLSSYILIGGRSSRMGSPKALLTIDGETFAQRAVSTVTKAFPDSNVSLVARDAQQFENDALPQNTKLVFDIYKDRGPYSGLHSALTDAQTDWIFILACDYPFVTAELLTILAQYIDDKYDAVVPIQQDRRLQTLCAFFKSKAFLPLIENAIVSFNLPPLHQLLAETRTRYIRFTELQYLPNSADLFRNINSPNDLNSLNS